MIKLEERKASIQPIKSKLKISILDDPEISQINQNTRSVLEEVGVTFPSDKALNIFAEVGANVDFEKNLVTGLHNGGSAARTRCPHRQR